MNSTVLCFIFEPEIIAQVSPILQKYFPENMNLENLIYVNDNFICGQNVLTYF